VRAVVQNFKVEGASMEPSLHSGQYLLINKVGYTRVDGTPLALVFPNTNGAANGDRYVFGAPQRGDIVVFRSPVQPDKDFIKRVIGVPGDRIQVRQGRLYINDVLVERQRIEDYLDSDNPAATGKSQYLETLPGGVTHRIIELNGDSSSPTDNTPIYVVPADHYFMMGDNRDGSNDSRTIIGADERCNTGTIDGNNKDCLGDVGFVPAENLIGPAKILFWSYGGSFQGYNPITWVTALRFDRLLNVIE
jgi:signal peptidase I